MPVTPHNVRVAPPLPPGSVRRAPLARNAPPSAEPVLASGLGLLTAFMIYSRLLETITLATGLRIPFFLSGLLILVFFSSLPSGRFFKCLSENRSIRYFLLFTCWMAICAPFSYWRGGTAKLLVFNWLPLIVGLIGIGATIRFPRTFHRMAGVMALSAATISFSSLAFGRFDVDDRLQVGTGTLGNSNDLALLLLVGLPFLSLLLLDKAWGVGSKLLALVTIPVAILAILRTGSRAALLALMVTFLLLFVFSYGVTRLKILAVGVIASVAMTAVLSDRLVTRLSTLFKENESATEASESTKRRQEKLIESIEMTLSHPILGVGPGVHDAAQADIDKQSGERPDWQVSHNTFTQVSSETGIPGFLLYMAALVGPLWRLWRARAAVFQIEALTPYRNLLSAFLTAGLSLMLTNVFGSNAYLFYMPLMMVMIDNAAVMANQLVADARAGARSSQTQKNQGASGNDPAKPVAAWLRDPRAATARPGR